MASYSVRWSIVSEDGHREQGVLAFAVGAGNASPQSGARGLRAFELERPRSCARCSSSACSPAAARPCSCCSRAACSATACARPLAHLLFFVLLAAFLGGSGIVHAAPPGTRFALVLKVAVTVVARRRSGGRARTDVPAAAAVAGACALALLAAPTLSGHALDRDQPRVLAPLVDVAHIAAAAVWLGGLARARLRRAARDRRRRARGARVVRRFSTAALVAVIVLGPPGSRAR